MRSANIYIFIILLTFYYEVQGARNQNYRKSKHEIRKQIQDDILEISNSTDPFETDSTEVEDLFDESTDNSTEISSADAVKNHQQQQKIPIFSKWSSWGRCEDCIQMRSRKCVQEEVCNDSRQLEERTCKSKRCKRKKRRKESPDVVVQLKDLRGQEGSGGGGRNKKKTSKKGKKPRIWSKWSVWTECSASCRTSRKRMCRKPGRCRKKIQTQFAYCYRESSYCESYVLNLLEKNQKNTKPTDRKISSFTFERNNFAYSPKKPARQQKCGIPYKKTNMLKIIGGIDSKKDKWPWHAAVINIFGEVFCAGTLINPSWVLTAAHCIRTILYIRLNEHDLHYVEGDEQQFPVMRSIRHPRFNRETVDNDIALLKLPHPVQAPTACLPSSMPLPGEMCHIMGWGKRKTWDQHGSSRLQEAKLPLVSSATCSQAYRSYHITKNMFCAGYSSGEADTCAGDSGGGLMCPPRKGDTKNRGYSVQGITSFGDGCGRRNKYGIYTAVHNYLGWINHVINTN